jgi:hypothetical protein
MSNIWRMLNIDSLTIDANFGLEYYLMGDIGKAKPLLTKGIQFCDMIQKGNLAITQEIINSSYIDAWEDIQILAKYKSKNELKTIVEDAALIKTDLTKILQENVVYSEEKIRNMQRFFIDAGKPYLSRAYNLMRRRKACRHL